MTRQEASPSADPDERVRQALDAAAQALGLAARELEGAQGDPGRWRWVALGLVSALGAGLIAALSGYDTAQLADVTDPADPARAAPLALLIRRARSASWLNDPERLRLSRTRLRQINRLLGLRNAAVHAMAFTPPADAAALIDAVLPVLRQLLLDAPSFNPERFAPQFEKVVSSLRAVEAARGGVRGS